MKIKKQILSSSRFSTSGVNMSSFHCHYALSKIFFTFFIHNTKEAHNKITKFLIHLWISSHLPYQVTLLNWWKNMKICDLHKEYLVGCFNTLSTVYASGLRIPGNLFATWHVNSITKWWQYISLITVSQPIKNQNFFTPKLLFITLWLFVWPWSLLHRCLWSLNLQLFDVLADKKCPSVYSIFACFSELWSHVG